MPRVNTRWLREQPTWVYRLTTTDNELLYVGVAYDVEKRMAQHRATKDWWRDVVFIDTERYPDRAQALAAEKHYIVTERPFHNIQHLPPEVESPFEPIGRRHWIWHAERRQILLQGQHGELDD